MIKLKVYHCQGFYSPQMYVNNFQRCTQAIFQIYSSHSFLILQAFFSIMFTIARSNPFIFLA